ncbi:Penicillin binding protein transpeptidase domain protein [anaerobic digester metagenome]
MKKSNNTTERRLFNRYTALFLIMLAVMGLIGRTLFGLQIVSGEEFQNKADAYSVKDISEPAPRGEILDRNGEVLATNLSSYDLIYNETRESAAQFYSVMGEFFRLLDRTGEELYDTFELKAEPAFAFDFKTSSPSASQARELRFKKDRNMDSWILKSGYGKMIGKTQIKDLSNEESEELNKMLLAVTPEETFQYLVRYHGLYKILGLSKTEEAALLKLTDREVTETVLKKLSVPELRRYMVIRDQVRMKVYQSNKSVPLVKTMTKQNAFVFMQKANLLAGIDVQLSPTRIYPYGTLGAHVLGYLSNISEYNKDKYESMGYDLNQDMIGVYGIEEAFEQELRGNKSVTTVKVDKQGRTVSELFKLEGYPGSSVQLTLDKDLQYTAQMALDATLKNLRTSFVDHTQGKSNNATRGAVVVIQVKTGKVLAMASNPDFDPNVFIAPGALTPELYSTYFNPDLEAFGTNLIQNLPIPGKTLDDIFPKNKEGVRQDYYDNYPKPFLNYATQGLSPVGSIFKPFTSLAALQHGVVDKNTIIDDTGVYERPELKGYRPTNNNSMPYGLLDLTEALKLSSNVFFLEMGWRMHQKSGPNAIAETVWKLGLGHDPTEGVHSTTGIEINENVYGNIFNFESRKQIIGRAAYGDLVNVLKKGIARDGKRFKPLDVSLKDTDSEKMRELKLEMDRGLREYWSKAQFNDPRTVDEKFDEIRQILDYNLNYIISLLPAEEQEGMADSTYLADQVASVLVYDRGRELTTPVNIMNASIGQGDAELTLLQIANAIATLANGGTRYRTSLVDRILDPEGNLVKVVEPEVLEEVKIKDEHLKLIYEGMHKVNTVEGGTAYRYMKDFPIETAGKTGTAQYRENNMANYVGRHQYGTYITFAPLEDPEIAIAVIGYDAIHGSFMIPVARAIYEEYFEERIQKEAPDYVRSFDYQLKPVMKVEPSLLKLEEPTELTTTPVIDSYLPGVPVPAYLNQPVNTRPDGTPPRIKTPQGEQPAEPEAPADPTGD